MEPRLKLAIQKSGRLLDDSLRILKDCGISIDNGKDQLRAVARNFPVEVYYLRNSDIPRYLHDGVADIGILGENTVLEKDLPLDHLLGLGFSRCRLSIALPRHAPYAGPETLRGRRIATSYPHSLRQFLDRHGVEADIHVISGSVEIAPNIGLADAICDLVSSGSTLFKNGLEEKEVVLRSEAALFANRDLDPALQPLLDQLLFRLRSVLRSRNHKYVLMNAPNASIEAIIELLPGMKSPTVMPLAVAGWSSIHTVISEDRFWEIIQNLKEAGAEGILVIPIEKMIT